MTDDGAAAPDEADPTTSEDDRAERRWKRSVAVTLALLACLGAWIGVLQTNAGTNESRTARDATRLAAEAQSAAVVEAGAAAAVDQVDAELSTLSNRSAFRVPLIDETQEANARAEQRVAVAEETIENALEGETPEFFDLQLEARETALAQAAVVDVRVTWNARASQYETVMTVLGVAIFLIGLTAVVSRGLRPPLALPGVLLAVFCLGWAIHIYAKPIPDPDPGAIAATAEAEALAESRHFAEAVEAADRAITADDSYLPAFEARAQARLLLLNPDLDVTLGLTEEDEEAYGPVESDLDRAQALGGDEDARALALAGLVSLATGDFDDAAGDFEAAIGINPLTPTLSLAMSAAQVALGDEVAAREWADRAAGQLGPTQQSDTNRSYAATYYTLLEYVADRVPEQRDLAEALRDETIGFETEIVSERPLASIQAESASLDLSELRFDEGTTTIDLESVDVPEGAVVTVVGYELPAEGASFVQPAELFYIGPSVYDQGSIELSTPRSCHPIEYRFDLYLEGVPVDRIEVPGVTATC